MISKLRFKKLITIICLVIFILFNTSFVFSASEPPDLTAKSAILLDTKTGKVLYNKNENERMYPASTTKILTAILTLENCDLDDIVTVKSDVSGTIPYGYTIVELQVGEKFTVEQLLELLLVHSANDVANLLAIHIAGSVESFASMMNSKVYELGLNDTHFTNPSGIHDDNHYTTAKDLATIMEYCIKNQDFRRLAGMASCSLPATNKFEPRSYESTNKLIIPNNSNYYEYITCGKTGYTDPAGECLVSCSYKDNLELVCVILGGEAIDNVPTRYKETKELYEYGYNNYSIKEILKENDTVTQINILNGEFNSRNLDLLASNSINVLLDNSQNKDDLECKIDLNNYALAPINQGDTLGTVSYIIDGNEYKTDLIASHSVERSQLIYYASKILIGVILIFIFCLLVFHRKKK